MWASGPNSSGLSMPPDADAMPRDFIATSSKTLSRTLRPAKVLVTRSPHETQAVGICIGRGLRAPCVVLLLGSLGSGKTTLARGIAEGLGLADPSLVSSPSYALVNVYQGICPIYHVDLYRLEGKRSFDSVGLDEFVGSRGVTIVEWGERLRLPVKPAAIIDLSDEGDDIRRLRIAGSRRLLALLRGPGPGQE